MEDVGGNDGEGDTPGSVFVSRTADGEGKWRETGCVGAGGSVIARLYTEPGGKRGNMTPVGTT